MAVSAPTIAIALDDQARAEDLRGNLDRVFQGRIDFRVGDQAGAVARLTSSPGQHRGGREDIVALNRWDLSAIVEMMVSSTQLNHFVSMAALDSGAWETPMAGALWMLLNRPRLSYSMFCGPDFLGRQTTIRDSSDRVSRLETVCSWAEEHGVGMRDRTRLQTVLDELVTNAVYDAPAEQQGVPADRTVRVVLPKQQACHIKYGKSGTMFFIRVRDPFGSLKRERLVEVLSRCAAQQAVPIDSSRGGAGLGMWRIFKSSDLLVVQVRRDRSTEFLAGFETGRVRGRGGGIHLFFDDADADGGQG